MKIEYIITFTCQPGKIFVYQQHCGKMPKKPYDEHKSIEDAREALKKTGLTDDDIEIVSYYSALLRSS